MLGSSSSFPHRPWLSLHGAVGKGQDTPALGPIEPASLLPDQELNPDFQRDFLVPFLLQATAQQLCSSEPPSHQLSLGCGLSLSLPCSC